MSRYERPLVSNGFVTITSNYEYIFEQLEGNALKFQLDFSEGGWIKEEVKIIAHELENTAKFFAEEQGLAASIDFGNLSVLTGNTGKLYQSIKGRTHGFEAYLTADARNSRGQFYAGHIEYGFHDRGDNFIPARPFLRPALYAVSEATKGHTRQIMKSLIKDMWSENGYQGWKHLEFERLFTDKGNKRWLMQQRVYGKESGLKLSNFLRNQYGLKTKSNNPRKILRQEGRLKGFSWDRYRVTDKSQKNHRDVKSQQTKWYVRYLLKPDLYKPYSADKRFALEHYMDGTKLTRRQQSFLTKEQKLKHADIRYKTINGKSLEKKTKNSSKKGKSSSTKKKQTNKGKKSSKKEKSKNKQNTNSGKKRPKYGKTRGQKERKKLTSYNSAFDLFD